jgi:acetolactate synthase-1/2/3 large subunit
MRRLSEKLGPDAIVVSDVGGVSVVVGHAFNTKSGQRYFTNNGNAPMGFGMAGAVGAWLAAPNRPVVAIIGDGGFNINIQELQTLVNYGVKVKSFILNNHIYGITKAFQETNFQGRCEACGPVGYNPPDFVKIVKAYGIAAFQINSNADIDGVIDQVMAHDGPAVCDVNCHDYHTYEPRIFGWSTPVEDMYPYLPRDEFRGNLYIEPYGDWENPEMPDISQPNTAME